MYKDWGVVSSNHIEDILTEHAFLSENEETCTCLSTRVVPDLTISNSTGAGWDMAGFKNSNPAGTGAGSGFGENLFSDHRTIRLMKLMASTMLSAAIKRQYSSVIPLLRHCLPVFNEICGTAMILYFCPGNTN